MDKAQRNALRNAVTQCRVLLEESVGELLEGHFGIHPNGGIEDPNRMGHLSPEEMNLREEIVASLRHVQATMFSGGTISKDAVQQLVREVGFTHLNRLCAYKILEQRKLMRESVGRGLNSNGFKFYLADNSDEERLWSSGQQQTAYRHFLLWLASTLSEEVGALFSRHDPANRLFPPYHVLEQVLALINGAELRNVWDEDEAIGWVYQYFTPKELRDKARKESQAPRNSYELAFRNQFYTPRYIVQFLVDNTLGRTWYEMRQGHTELKVRCTYLLYRPNELFPKKGETPQLADVDLDRSTIVPHRAKKDPREIRVLDPACGSGHFLLYCFDLLETMYAEAYEDPDLGHTLKHDYPDAEQFRRAVPALILRHNLYGIDIDLRATQITTLALWLRARRAFKDLGLGNDERPKIRRANIVCAEPMPGEIDLLDDFVRDLQPAVLGQLARRVFAKMKLASEAGSLLKIEQGIQSDIEDARKQWKAGSKEEQLLLWEEARRPRPEQFSLFDVAGITDAAFWDEAEAGLLDALRTYAENASSGRAYARGLFAEDAAQGFGFINLSRTTYDVVLMNPPFGDGSKPSKGYIEDHYPRTRNDVFAAFVERGLSWLQPGGALGAITSRSGFFLSSFQKWREEILLNESRPIVFADLGNGVLDTAMVETAAYCLQRVAGTGLTRDAAQLSNKASYNGSIENERADGNGRRMKATFIRLLGNDDKASALAEATSAEQNGTSENFATFHVQPSSFRQVPGAPFAYWVGDSVRRKFSELSPFEGKGRSGRLGVNTTDDFRFLRSAWEVPAESLRRRWVPIFKGGGYAPYYLGTTLVMDWENNGQRLKAYIESRGDSPSRNVRSESRYLKRGLTYASRTQKGLAFQPLPEGCIFTVKGPALFAADEEDLAALLGLVNSTTFRELVALQMAFGSYEIGVIQRTPIPDLSAADRVHLSGLALECVGLRRRLHQTIETSFLFLLPALLTTSGSRLIDRHQSWKELADQWEGAFEKARCKVDDFAYALYGMRNDEPRATIGYEVSEAGSTSPISTGNSELEFPEDAVGPDLDEGQDELVKGLLAYALGCAFGRWDVRIAMDSSLAPKLADPFAVLPASSPGMLVGVDGLPAHSDGVVSEEWLRSRPDAITLPRDGAVRRATIPDAEYPIKIAWDGILVDDPEHSQDVVRRVREVLDLLWGARADATEHEVCDIIGVKGLRDYFGNPRGFFEDHVQRYSKSRRKSPIFWLLQSSKRSYGLWLYYHRLDADLLFKALTNYVDPKVQREEGRLDDMRLRKSQSGTTVSAARHTERTIERQEALIAELRDFRDKLSRATSLGLKPDLDDGVVLNAAPLWELLPWKVAKDYWQELLKGEYAWSSVAGQLNAKHLVAT